MKHSPFIASNNINLSIFVSSFAMALVLAFLGLFFVTSNDSMAKVTYWTNTEYLATKFVGSGTETDPYQITNAKELALVAYRVNNTEGYSSQCYSLENNISLVAPDKSGNQIVWEPIGTEKKPFSGVFWGNGHTISGMYINQTNGDYAGLFGKVSGTGKVEHIRVEGKITLSASSPSVTHVGGVIAYWESNTPISKLTSDVNIVTEYSSFVGGIVGVSYANIDQCFSLGKINSAAENIGGIAGRCLGQKIKNCFNKGGVFGSYTQDNNVGGIVGWTFSDEISFCYNLGKVSGGLVGGIAGYTEDFFEDKIRHLEVKYCYNKGNILSLGLGGSSSFHIAGGIVGRAKYIKISNCTNFADAVSDMNCGGIIGKSSKIANAVYCTNFGTIKGFGGVGGIIGNMSEFSISSTSIHDCHNKGMIRGTRYVGGIIGWISFSNTTTAYSIPIKYCINTANINAGDYIGGIIGEAMHSSIECCMNMGDVTSTSWIGVGGIVGSFSGNRNLDLINSCINYGYVKSTYEYTNEDIKGNGISVGVGGIVGYLEKLSVRAISECINVGKVSAPNATKDKYKNRYTGQLVGRNVNNSNNNSNCYVLKDGLPAFGTNDKSGIDTSNGTPKRITGAEYNTISLSSSFKRYKNPQNDYEKSCLKKLQKIYSNINSLILVVEKVYNTTNVVSIPDYTSNNNIPYDFEVGVDNLIWGFGNPNINNGQPYLKGWYWDGTSGGTSQKIEISYKVYLDGKESLSGTKTLDKGQSYTWQTFLNQAPAGYKYKEGGSGKSYSDTSVNIYFETIKYKLTVNYMDYTKNTTLEKSITEYIKQGDIVYLSDYNSKGIDGYKHFKTDCSATTNDRFAMKEDTTIIVYYKKLVEWTITYKCDGKQVGDVVRGTDMVGTYISYNVPTGYELKYAATGMYVSESKPNIEIVVQKEGKKTIQVYYIENGKINYSKSKTIETQSGKTIGEAFEEAGISDWLDMCYYDFGDWFEKVNKNDIVKRDTDVYYYLS